MLRSMTRRVAVLVFALLALALIAWLCWLFASSQPFGDCINQRKNYQEYQAIHEETLLAVKIFARINLHAVCSAHVINVYQGAVAALSGIILALFTSTLWWVTRRSVRASENSAKAARDGIELARTSFIVEHRAYITPVEFMTDRILYVATGRASWWKFTPRWRNTGNTPAKGVRHLTNAKLFTAEGMPADFDFPDNERNGPDRTVGTIIGPSFTINGPECQIDATIFRDILKKYRMFIWSWIEYRDVFQNTPIRRTEWCVELIAKGDFTNPGVDGEAVFSLISVGRFNGVDEDCYRKAGEEARLMNLAEMAPQEAGLLRLVLTSSFSFPYPGWPAPTGK